MVAEGVDLKELVREAKRKGYFATEEYPGFSFTRDGFRELMTLLQRHNIPFGSPDERLAKKIQKPISPKIAHKIINALRKGIPPVEGVSHFSMGRESLLDQFRRNLQGVNQGHSLVRFMNADVGRGKTHALYLLREMAFREGFVVSIVTLSQNSCPLHDFMQVYHTVMWHIRTDEERKESALESVLDRWLDVMGERRRIPQCYEPCATI
jgi:predicted ATPase